MQGTIVQVNISPGGLPKRAIPRAILMELGLEGDGHEHPQIHGGPRKAVLLMSAEAIDELKTRGYPVFYGAMGEDLTLRGIALGSLRPGDRLRAGGAVIEITRPRGPCSALDLYGASLKHEIRDAPEISGLYARVIAPGLIEPGDIIALEPQPA